MDTSEYLKSAYELIKSQSSADELIPASRVGLLLRGAQGGPRWEEHGFKALKYLLREMEARGLLHLGETGGGALALRLVDSRHPAPGANDASNSSHGTFNQLLRSEIWRAFVVEEPRGKRFINKESREVLMGLMEPPPPIEDWIELIPIPAQTQRIWAKDFLAGKNLSSDSALLESLESVDWYRRFPTVLETHSPSLASDWNRHRSNLVARQVSQWCDEHQLKYQFAFRSQVSRRDSPSSLPLPSLHAQWDETQLRAVLMDALSYAPVERLLDLPIPPRYVLRALMQHSGGS